jgi:tRNA A58 N-methylase Trm61
MSLGQADYVLGHTDREQSRLIRQARVLAPTTERFLRDTGIVSGMRVLDVGCGMGDVAMLVAQVVGSQGSVTSIDLDHRSVATARKRASALGLDNTTFQTADISTFWEAEPFDAIVGRRQRQSGDYAGCCDLAASWRFKSRAGNFGSTTRPICRYAWPLRP